MSESPHRKLRQSTLQFKPKPSSPKKRKMERENHEQEEKRKKAADAAEKRAANSAASPEQSDDKKPQTSKYFDNKEGTEPKEDKEIKPTEKKAGEGISETAGSSVDPQKEKPDEEASTQPYKMSPEEPGDSQKTEASDDSLDGVMQIDIPNKKPSMLQRESSWRGIKLKDLKTTPNCLGSVKPLSKKDHTVLIKLPYIFSDKDTCPPSPYPAGFLDKWDQDHVRMPCSPQNEYPVETKTSKTTLRRRWELIGEALSGKISGPFELEDAILTYNQRYSKKWDFTAMKQYFIDYMRKEERNDFFANTLPKMVKLALQLPLLCTMPIPLLKQGKPHSITMSQQQVACLLANAFFCTFPRRNARQRHAEYSNYPEINFNILFQGHPSRRKMEKLRCVIHYFTRVTDKVPLGTVTFQRKVIAPGRFPKWDELGTEFSNLHVSSAGTIEDDGKGMLQVDFANKYIGGGVLGMGAVQEEIRFLICPEMIITRLFTEVLDKNESLIMLGCEQFSKYEGYADSFTWDGDFQDQTPRDVNGRLHTEVVAIDALVIRDRKKQFQKWCVQRELNKAYVGFHCGEESAKNLSAVCTGNWGCGAFGGDKSLKALIQMIAASVAKRDVCYFTFDDDQLTDQLYKIHAFIKNENGLEVGNVMQLIDQYSRNVMQKIWWNAKPKKNLFEYIVAAFEGTLDSDTTGDDFSEGSLEAQGDLDDSNHGNEEKMEVDEKGIEPDYKANTP
ncbi:poly(ADP-ribose) glycohydrolase-like [Haliotis rufescens]|uniref:poly(ADP-ribose) glycohydrolase-like n=1 Tax=Haliotis rufescens TaxID=6454 RepID=UPI00201EC032|nr:poly(ADP-ribose) glycohydrolase-like [Haliotis rufescens]XP_048248209.1 poly(ADP-ribose) glycohydrolase-like [Haliotis rufescens]